MDTLECLVKKHKPCWACKHKPGCDTEQEDVCTSSASQLFSLRDYGGITPDVAVYKERYDALEREKIESTGVISRLNNGIDAILLAHEQGYTNFDVSAEGLSGEYKLLAYGILELASFGMEDMLTLLPNRRNFDTRLNMEWKRAIRKRSSISLLLLDIDYFKRYNDTFGHLQGDTALRAVGATLKQFARRPGDLTARWGGEEFGIFLADTDSDGALYVAEQIRTSIEELKIPSVMEEARSITVSIGVSTSYPINESDLSDFIDEADKALYHAKSLGRNRSCLYDTSMRGKRS
jgi:diguanylate cyclase (GGDEF)-like protein